jgi:hypothetical protein
MMCMLAGITMTPLRSYVTGSINAILNEVGQITAVPRVRAHCGPEGASGHSFRTPRVPTGHQSQGLDQYDKLGLAAKLP